MTEPAQIEMDFSRPKIRLFEVQDFKVGAVYLFAARRRLGRGDIVTLLVERAKLKTDAADLLAGHWMTTEPYRKGTLTSGRRLRPQS